MNNRNEPIGGGLLFLWAWWRLDAYPHIGGGAFFCALGLWLVGWIAIRMFSSTVHRLGFWGWVMMLEVALWYGVVFWLTPLEKATTAFLLWGVATPLLFIGNVWRRAHDRFLPIQGAMRAIAKISAVVGVAVVPIVAWQIGRDFLFQLGIVSASFVAVTGLLFYGWRLAAPPPGGAYDARLGSMDEFRLRGQSHER